MASYPGSRFRTPLREVRRCFSQAARTTTPGAADCQARSPPGLSGLAAETLLTPGRRNDPCGTRPPSSPLLWAGRPLTSSDRRDPPAPSPAISRTTRTPSPSEHHALDTLPPCPPRHQNTGPPLPEKNHSLQTSRAPSPKNGHAATRPAHIRPTTRPRHTRPATRQTPANDQAGPPIPGQEQGARPTLPT